MQPRRLAHHDLPLTDERIVPRVEDQLLADPVEGLLDGDSRLANHVDRVLGHGDARYLGDRLEDRGHRGRGYVRTGEQVARVDEGLDIWRVLALAGPVEVVAHAGRGRRQPAGIR